MTEEISNGVRSINQIPRHPLYSSQPSTTVSHKDYPKWFSQGYILDIVDMIGNFNTEDGKRSNFLTRAWAVQWSGNSLIAIVPDVYGDLNSFTYRYESARLIHLPTGLAFAGGPPAEMHSLMRAYHKYGDFDDCVHADGVNPNHPANLRLKAIYQAWRDKIKAAVDIWYQETVSQTEAEILEPPTINLILRHMHDKESSRDLSPAIEESHRKLLKKAASEALPAKSHHLPATLDIDAEVVQRIKGKLESLHGLINGTATPFSPVLVQEIEFLDKLMATAGEGGE